MKAVIIALLLVASTLATRHPVNHQIVSEIKGMETTWIPMEPEENPFAYKSIEEIKGMMGTKLAINYTDFTETDYGFKPKDSFDAREEWPGKIHAIRDQGKCGSCWAFGASEAISDRWAIEGKDKILSPQHMVDCDLNNFGCDGGYLLLAWDFIQNSGIVDEDCYPYVSGSTKVAGECKNACTSANKEWKPSKSKGIDHPGSILLIQEEIQKNGPVEAAFTVYEDFMNYKKGVYQHISGGLLGGHAVKCLGWGNEGGVDYWLMANSWGTQWGDNGFFKIKMGDCGVEKQIYTSKPDHSSA